MTSSYQLGTDDCSYLSSPSINQYDFQGRDFSIEAWVKTFQGGPLVTHSGKSCFSLSLKLGKIHFQTYSDRSLDLSVDVNICDGVWHHVAVVCDEKNDGAIYLDGKKCEISGPGQCSNTCPDIYTSTKLMIGALGNNGDHLVGYVAEIRLWNKARTESDLALYQHRRLRPENLDPTLVGYWSGEFGLAVDLSLIRNTTQGVGTIRGANDSPPLSYPSPESFCAFFKGIYTTTKKQEGIYTTTKKQEGIYTTTKKQEGIYTTTKKQYGEWALAEQLTITSHGFFIIGYSIHAKVLNKVKIDGVNVRWSDGLSGANVKFKVESFRRRQTMFDGTFTSASNTTVSYHGDSIPTSSNYGILLNVGKAKVLSCVGRGINCPVILQEASVIKQDHFGEHTLSDNTISVSLVGSKLALQSKSADLAADGNQLCNRAIVLSDTTPTKWTLEQNAIVFDQDGKKFALSAGDDNEDGTCSVVAAPFNNDLNQQWLPLKNSRPIINGHKLLLTAQSRHEVAASQKVDGNPGQSWYIIEHSLICASLTLALTVPNATEEDQRLTLEHWEPGNRGQQFEFYGKRIRHIETGRLLSSDEGGVLILVEQENNEAENNEAGIHWDISGIPSPDYPHPRVRRQEESDAKNLMDPNTPGQKNTTYVIRIDTADSFLAGTDDDVEITLENRYNLSTVVKFTLTDNENHTDPFERGSSDIFRFEAHDIGQITDVTIWFAKNAKFFVNTWELKAITVTNVDRHLVTFSNSPFTMSQATTETFSMKTYPTATYNSEMMLCRATARGPWGDRFGWEHTWIEVRGPGGAKPTYFDCAGGHSSTANGLIMGRCSLNEVVRMSTGKNIDMKQNRKESYGTNMTDGTENAGVRAEGWINWDGQCHQIANRYLWTCLPSSSIDNAYNEIPHGYGLSTLAFGKYGVNFQTWCREHEFGDIEVNEEISILGMIQRSNLRGTVEHIKTYINIFRDEISKTASAQPNGQQVKKLLTSLLEKDEKIDVADFLNLTTTEIEQITQG